ncbi:MAG: hypothetical protein ACTSVO_05800 [Candidatus Heimdallarchaeaceae archaeon]
MPRFVQGPTFDKYKRELSVSSRSVKNSLALLLLLGFILTVTSILSFIFIVIPSSYTLMQLDLLSQYSINIISDFYALSPVLFIIFAISEIIFLGFFAFYLYQISIHAKNHFRIFTLQRQEKSFQYTGIFLTLYVTFSVLGFIPISYLNTTMFLIAAIMFFLALFMNYKTFRTFQIQMRFIKKPFFLPLVGGIINILSWITMYFTILGIYGNLIGLFLIFLGFKKLVVDYKLISEESKIHSSDPSTPAPSSPIPKAPAIYNRTMIEDETPEPSSIEDSSVPSPVVPEPTIVEDSSVPSPIAPESSSPSDLSVDAPSFAAPKPLDINQKFCQNCKRVVYKSDKRCPYCDFDLTQIQI